MNYQAVSRAADVCRDALFVVIFERVGKITTKVGSSLIRFRGNKLSADIVEICAIYSIIPDCQSELTRIIGVSPHSAWRANHA